MTNSLTDHFPDLFREKQHQIDELLARPMLFVVGAPKSGTTWLQLCLNGHPAIHCGGEGHFTDWLGEPMMRLIQDYNRQIGWVNRVVYQDNSFYHGLGRTEGHFLLRTMIGLALSRVKIKPGARFIAITRDLRDAAWSILCQRDRLAAINDLPANDPGPDQTLRLFIEKWLKVEHAIQQFSDQHPDCLYRLRYEDLHADPLPILAAIMAFLGVDHDPAILEQCRAAGAFETRSNGRPRGQEDPTSFFRKGVIGDGKTGLTATQHQLIMERAGEEIRRLGYDVG